ncbi:Uncharacterised protein [Enterobacter cloacae]|nr:Uncharacterised protein [Enterobacter cloacae]
MAVWPTMTPFGRPVEPEVKMMYAVCSGFASRSGSAPAAGNSVL